MFDKDKMAYYLRMDNEQLNKEIIEKTTFYATGDFSEEDKLFIYLLAKVRDLNDDNLNGYKIRNKYHISYLNNKVIVDEDNFIDNFFKFLDDNKLKYY